MAIAKSSSPHTVENLLNETNHAYYDFWKKLTIEKMGDEGVILLTDKIE